MQDGKKAKKWEDRTRMGINLILPKACIISVTDTQHRDRTGISPVSLHI
jgi:hypothetical protein